MKKGFTLVELLGVIIVLAIISLITFPITNSIIKKSRENAYEIQKKEIVEAAHKWAIDKIDLLPSIDSEDIYILKLDELINSGFIEDTDNGNLINPIDESIMEGCVKIRYSKEYNQYIYEYEENCE